jgi:hypothetical protein
MYQFSEGHSSTIFDSAEIRQRSRGRCLSVLKGSDFPRGAVDSIRRSVRSPYMKVLPGTKYEDKNQELRAWREDADFEKRLFGGTD